MSNVKIDELQKLYKDTKVNTFFQELCEYYATKSDYQENSYEEEIEPENIVEPIYLLFCLQRRDTSLSSFEYIRKKYPNLFECIQTIYEKLLLGMNTTALYNELSAELEKSFSLTSENILERSDHYNSLYDDQAEAMEHFYDYMKSYKKV
ncbi:MAG: hypothetical protein K6B41_10445 [Butyrivibrio sp.]|nr:hypothetical protein [Butyrivibrio sp.]